MLRTSERKAFKQCEQQWWWRYHLGLVRRERKGGALWFGTGIHLALEHWYVPGTKRGVDPRETWEKFCKDQVEYIKTLIVRGEKADGEQMQYVEALDLGNAILTNYLKTYGHDKKWRVISPEQTAQILIPDHRDKTKKIVRYLATFDLVAEDLETGNIWLWDHKTATSITTGHLTMDDQAGSYWAIAKSVLVHQGLMKASQRLTGILYNFIMKSEPDERPENAAGEKLNNPKKEHYLKALAGITSGDQWELPELKKLTLKELAEAAELVNVVVEGDVSQKQPAERLRRVPVERTKAERAKQVRRISQESVRMNMIRNGELDPMKNPTDKCGFCEFKEVCETDERGGDTEELIDMLFKYEDPYAAHR